MICKTIILLASSPLQKNGRFADFKDGMYLGGQVRMEAAAEIVKKQPSTELVLVAGHNKFERHHESDQLKDMAHYLRSQAPKAKLTLIHSLPCTHHNFVAFLNTWQAGHISAEEVGILTNTYHLDRALAFAREAAKMVVPDNPIRFTPISAEEVRGRSIASIAGNKMDQYNARLASEQRGLRQIKSGTYEDSCLEHHLKNLLPIIARNADILLTSAERARVLGTPH